MRIILFFILFLFALNTNKENYTNNVTPVISDKQVEQNRKIKDFFNDIYKYNTGSNYMICYTY